VKEKEKEGRGRREKGGAGGACYCAVVGVETMKQSHSKIFRAILVYIYFEKREPF